MAESESDSWSDMLSQAGDSPAFLRIWTGVQGTGPALEIGVLAARICHLMSLIRGGAAAGLPTVMSLYWSGFYDAMAEAELLGPAPSSASAAVTPACALSAVTGARRSLVGRRGPRRAGLPIVAAVTAAGSPSRRSVKAIKSEFSEQPAGAITAALPREDEAGSGSHQAVRAAASTTLVQVTGNAQPAESVLINRLHGGRFCSCCGMCGRKRCTVGKKKRVLPSRRCRDCLHRRSGSLLSVLQRLRLRGL